MAKLWTSKKMMQKVLGRRVLLTNRRKIVEISDLSKALLKNNHNKAVLDALKAAKKKGENILG